MPHIHLHQLNNLGMQAWERLSAGYGRDVVRHARLCLLLRQLLLRRRLPLMRQLLLRQLLLRA